MSRTAQFSATIALRGSVTTVDSRCGMPSKTLNSSILGSIMIRRHWLGGIRNRMDRIMVFRPTDLPEPVVPATSKCGILARSATTGSPPMVLPSTTDSGARAFS